MGEIVAALSFRFWIGIARELIFAVDARRYGRPHHVPGTTLACTIESEDRWLRGLIALPPGRPAAAALILPGIGDRVEYWIAAQELLQERRIASLVFHYSGYATSTGATTPENLHRDAHAAYLYLRSQVDADVPVFVLGFSLGSGLAVEAARTLQPAPHGVIIAQPYTTLRLAAAEVVKPFRFLRYLLPDIWQTVYTIRKRSYPLLIVHSEQDELFPAGMASAIYNSALEDADWPVHLSIHKGFAHNAIYLNVPPDYWQPILDFIDSIALSTKGALI